MNYNPPKNHTVQITDLGSRNGVKVFTKEGNIRADLKGDGATTVMEVGDFMLTGGGESPEQGGRQIGFRVCQNAERGEIFLVKFNIRSLQDLLMIAGHDVSPEALRRAEEAVLKREMGQPIHESDTEEDKAVRALYAKCFSSMARLRSERTTDKYSLRTFETIQEALTITLDGIKDLAVRFFNNDWTAAAIHVGKYAADQGVKAKEQKDMQKALVALDAALLLTGFGSHSLPPQTTEK